MNNKEKDIYLNKVDQRGPIEVWLVDGKKVRKDINEEFTNFGQHYHFNFIPENEFWLDNEASPNEQDFFIEHLLIEKKLMSLGISYSQALDKANEKEIKERLRSGDLKKVITKNGKIDLNKIHKELLGKTDEDISIWLVDARLVRSVFDLNFTEGGHDFVYPYVPFKEVWLDDDIFPNERAYVLLHEFFERNLMEKENLIYPEAHKLASRLEWEARHNKNKLKKTLGKLKLDKINLFIEKI